MIITMFIFHNKIVLVSGINVLCKLLQHPHVLPTPPTFSMFMNIPSLYNNRIAIKYSMKSEYFQTVQSKSERNNSTASDSTYLHMIRLWKTKSVFDLWYDDFNTRNFVGALDYTIHPEHIKIEYMSINEPAKNSRDKMYKKLLDRNNDVMTTEESDELRRAMLHFMKNLAKEEQKSKIVVDVYDNLKLFNQYYRDEGFRITDQKCSRYNPHWIESEFDVV